MEIALTGFNPQFESSTSVDTARLRQRQLQDAQRQSSNINQRESERQGNQTREQANTRAPAQSAVEGARVINGEVLSSETVRVSARDADSRAGATVLPRNTASQSSFNGQASNRRIPVEQAIQTFQENEVLVLAESNPRQVSGIVDEFV